MLNRDGSFLPACQSWSLCERNCEVWRNPASCLPGSSMPECVYLLSEEAFLRSSSIILLLCQALGREKPPHRVTNLYASAGLLQLTDDALDSVIIAHHHCYSIRELCLEMRTCVSILTHNCKNVCCTHKRIHTDANSGVLIQTNININMPEKRKSFYLLCLVNTVKRGHFTVLMGAEHFTHRTSGNAAGQAVNVDFLILMDFTHRLVNLLFRRRSAALENNSSMSIKVWHLRLNYKKQILRFQTFRLLPQMWTGLQMNA